MYNLCNVWITLAWYNYPTFFFYNIQAHGPSRKQDCVPRGLVFLFRAWYGQGV